jgi:hypothetical protein
VTSPPYTTMLLIMHNITKGIPPQLHNLKPKAKPCTKTDSMKTKPKEKKGCKRVIISDNEGEEEGLSSDSSVVTTNRTRKQQHVEASNANSEVEIVDQDVEPPKKGVEQVDDAHSQEEPTDEQEVSLIHLMKCTDTHHILG